MKFYFVQNQFVAESLSKHANVNLFNAGDFNGIVSVTTNKPGIASKLAVAMFKNIMADEGNVIIPFPDGDTMDPFVGSLLKDCMQTIPKDDIAIVTMSDCDDEFLNGIQCAKINLVDAIWTFLQGGEVPFNTGAADTDTSDVDMPTSDSSSISDMP